MAPVDPPALILADARRIPLKDGCVQCVVTSPPYWGLRDYGVEGQIGLEPTPEAYVESLVGVFREVWRVLRCDGTVWLNIGESYDNRGLLAAVPPRMLLALIADGWLAQSEVVWSKPIGAPAGGVRRPLRSHESLFLLSRGSDYYYDGDAIREPLAAATLERYKYPVKSIRSRLSGSETTKILTPDPSGRHRRSVWTVTPTSARYDGQHHAVMPDELAEPCILAGSRPGDLVFDPFGGSGTTVRVARRFNRRGVMLDLNPAYLELAKQRNANLQPSILDLADEASA